MCFISGQNKLNETSRFTGIPIRTYGQQEADIIPLINSITKYAVMIDDPNRIGYELDKALHLSKTGRKGPVWIDIPLDVQDMRINQTELERFNSKKAEIIHPNESDLNYFINQIENSKRPVLLIGSGISSSGAKKELETFIKKTNIPLTYGSSAVDTYSLENSLSIGSVGAMGCSRAGNFAVQNSDLLIVLGNRLTSMTTGESRKFARDAKVIIIDIDKIEHSKKNVKYQRLILSDLKFFLGSVLKRKLKKTDDKWVKKCMHWKIFSPSTKIRLNLLIK